jgi:hypothetical protein
MTTNVVGPAGIPRYFQFDVPTNGLPAGVPPQAVAVWLSGANSNLTLVLSEHLPLPDLNHYDYISQQPSTNNEIVMLVTNSTPFPNQPLVRWGVQHHRHQRPILSPGVPPYGLPGDHSSHQQHPIRCGLGRRRVRCSPGTAATVLLRLSH